MKRLCLVAHKDVSQLIDVDYRENFGFVYLVNTSTGSELVGFPHHIDIPSADTVRWMDDGSVLLINHLSPVGAVNATIIQPDGSMDALSIEPGFSHLVVGRDFIAAGFVEDLIYTSETAAGEAIAIYDGRGAFLFGHQTEFGSSEKHIGNTYALTASEDGRIFFSGDGIDLVVIDPKARVQETFFLPPALQEPSGLAISEDGLLVLCPRSDPTGIFYFDFESYELISRIDHEYFVTAFGVTGLSPLVAVRGCATGQFLLKTMDQFFVFQMEIHGA